MAIDGVHDYDGVRYSIRQPQIGDMVLIHRKGHPDQLRPAVVIEVSDKSSIISVTAFGNASFTNVYKRIPHKLFNPKAEHTWEYIPDPPISRIYHCGEDNHEWETVFDMAWTPEHHSEFCTKCGKAKEVVANESG